ncbi:hypothetical protein [Natronosalvus halobius]|uniref:hypothetical protein n=1 Tax=Natronosalvus halobius TaxID=2953746 RepID=UPI00209E6291|nr:hypothetical protein [Natronosalvus halobius]USZ72296.1 hypothetical protein NGM15_03010 [Natronosalvus halobius]
MSSIHNQRRIPARYGIVLGAILFISFAYAIITAQILLWVWGLVALFSLGLSVFVVYLFYRLVRAVERIAYEH